MAKSQFQSPCPVESAVGEQEPLERLDPPQKRSAPTPWSASRPVNQKFQRKKIPLKSRTTVASVCVWIIDHQLAIALNLLSLLTLVHIACPAGRGHTRKFSKLSYYNDQTKQYALGVDDGLFVGFWIVLLTGLRAGVIDYILVPLASGIGIEKRKARVRFAEQAWLLCHHGTAWFCGMYIWYNSTYWLNLRALWADYPIRELDGSVKYYYLVAFAFWVQQLVVVNIEERRKDHLQMFTHHMITCTLMFCSYCYHQTKVGNVILCLMDVVDLFLPLAKILKYLQFRLACDAAFGAFMITWFIARHVCYMAICWSIYSHIPEEITFGCYRGSAAHLEGPLPIPDQYVYLIEPFFKPTGLVCWSLGIGQIFLGVLLALQGILLIWLSMIVKIAYRVLTGQGADDTRSDDEDSELEPEEEAEDAIDQIWLCAEPRPHVPLANLPIEMEVGYEEMRMPSSRLNRAHPVRRSTRKSDGHTAATTSVSLRGSSNRKQLLGRIGCDKGS